MGASVHSFGALEVAEGNGGLRLAITEERLRNVGRYYALDMGLKIAKKLEFIYPVVRIWLPYIRHA